MVRNNQQGLPMKIQKILMRGANGTFEFSGKYGDDPIAQWSYKEVNGRRKGSLSAEMPK
jgi:hypothetical protein